MKTIITLLFVMIISISFGQITNEHYFSDTTTTFNNITCIFDYLEVDDGILISAKKTIDEMEEPVILKLNTNGELVWFTVCTISVETPYCRDFKFVLFDDGYIYGVSKKYWNPAIDPKTIYKINAETGEVLWTKLFDPDVKELKEFVEYDSTSFVAIYYTQNCATLAIFDKASGDTICTKSFVTYSDYFNLAVDNNKNIYFSEDKKLCKFNLNDFDQIIWEREYLNETYDMDVIHELYIDDYDNIFLFGRDGGSYGNGAGIINKVDNSTGILEWNTLAVSGELRIKDFVDFDGKIYCTYKHTLVGSGNFKFKTAKVNKQDGNVDWYSYLDVDPLGETTSHSGNGESALSIDVDCSGDVYLTGYYGSANYGPAAWGIMKLANSDGEKIYDLTITDDSTQYDEYSVGLAACVFGNSPIIIGHLEDTAGNVNPLFVNIDSNTGEVVRRNFIAKGYQSVSKTIDIVNQNDTTYVLKQQGELVIIEQYDVNNTLIWEKNLVDTCMLQGKQLMVMDNSIYLSVSRFETDTLPPFFIDQSNSFTMYKLDKTNSDILDTVTVMDTFNVVVPFELEANNNVAYIFYNKDDSICYRKWDPTGLSIEHLLEHSSNNMNYEGKLNIVLNNNADSLLVLGASEIYAIDKNSLSKSSIYTYSTPLEYYNIYSESDTMYLSGSNMLNEQLVTAINISNMTLIWEQTYEIDGALYKIVSDDNNKLYAMGSSNNTITVHEISSTDGSLNWSYFEDSILYPFTMPYDLEIHKSSNFLTMAGANIHDDGSSDAIIELLDLQGDTLFSFIGVDELGEKSQANTIEILSDSSVWVGGSFNRISYSKQGFIYSLTYDTTTVITSIREISNELNVLVYPNPTEGLIYLNGIEGELSYTIFDLTGKKCIEQINVSNSVINIGALLDGIYIICIEQNNKFKTIKIVKE